MSLVNGSLLKKLVNSPLLPIGGGFTVLDEFGASFNAPLIVLDEFGVPFNVPKIVLDEDGNPLNPI